MTSGAVIGNGLAVGAGVAAIVAAEAAGGIVVAKVIRVRTPPHTHVWKDIAQVDTGHFLARLPHCGGPRSIDFRIISLIKLGYLARDALLRYFASGVIHLEHLNRFFPDVGQVRADPPNRHLLVHGIFRKIEGVSGPVVAIHAIHHPMFALVQLFFGRLCIRRNEFGSLPLGVGVIHDGNRLPLGIRRNVANTHTVGEVMPVNPHGTLPRASAHLHQKHIGLWRVFLVVFVTRIHQEFVARKALRPMSLLTGGLGGAKVLHWRWNRARISVKRYRVDLTQTRNL